MIIELEKIRIDGGTQSRVSINQELVTEYANEIMEGEIFPAITVFNDGASIWLAEGFHRYFAHLKAMVDSIEADVKKGTVRDAILFAVGSNATHGLRRTNADKTKAITMLLKDPEWSDWSDREIARQTQASNHLVAKIRKDLSGNSPTSKRNPILTKEIPETKSEIVTQVLAVNDLDKETIETLLEENDRLKSQIAIGLMPTNDEEKHLAAAYVDQLRAEIKSLKAENRALKESRNSFQTANAELKNQIKYLQSQLRKLEKAV